MLGQYMHCLPRRKQSLAWPSTSSNRRLESGADRRPWIIATIAGLFIILIIVLLTSGGDHPCIAIQDTCEEEISEGIKSKRDTVCMGIFMKLHTVWDLEDENSAKKCESWDQMVQAASDDEVPGIDQWKTSLEAVKEDLGVPATSEGAGALIIGPTTGEWFNDERGGRRLELQGTLRVDPAGGTLRKVRVKATLTIHFAGGRNPRKKEVVMGFRDQMPPGSQIQISSQDATTVGADERTMVKKISIILEARALDSKGRKMKRQLVEPNMETQEEKKRFPIGGQHSFDVR